LIVDEMAIACQTTLVTLLLEEKKGANQIEKQGVDGGRFVN